MSMSTSEKPVATPPARVWFLQPSVEHYRIPIWDGLVQRGEGRYVIEVHGPLQNGHAFGGEARPYLHDLEERTISLFGQPMYYWPEAPAKVRAARPDVVIVTGNLRSLTCWQAPRICRSIGAVPVAWTKAHSFSGLPAALLSRLKRRLFWSYELIVAYGKLSRQELLDVGVPDERIVVAQNTIDTSRIFSDGQAISRRGAELKRKAGLQGKRVLLCVARFDPVKRHCDLLAAWPRLRKIDNDLRLVLVGGGPLLEKIRQEASRLDSERILVTGRVPEGDDYAWIAAADFNVQPGAVGLAINQSMAFGTPTIIADEVGVDTEILEHDRTGWRYPRGDLDAFVNLIAELRADESRVRRVTTEARSLMKDRVTIDNMVDHFDEVICRALECRPSKKEQT